MAEINWESETSKPAGAYHVEVARCNEGIGKDSGETYFTVFLYEVKSKGSSTDATLVCKDIISFAPKALSMTIAKLKALGFDKSTKSVDAEHLVGRRCHIMTRVEQSDKYGARLVVDISAPGYHVGYKAEGEVETAEKEVDSDVPW